MTHLTLVAPAPDFLSSFVAALERGWSPDMQQHPVGASALMARIAKDPFGFLADQDDRDGRLPALTLPDGTSAPRLPGYHRWMWDGEFCGRISVRWQPGTPALPPTCLGHIGYTVVPWKQRRGYATRALGLLLPELSALGLPSVELVTDPANLASQQVMLANGAVLVESFHEPAIYGGHLCLRYRIALHRAVERRANPTPLYPPPDLSMDALLATECPAATADTGQPAVPDTSVDQEP